MVDLLLELILICAFILGLAYATEHVLNLRTKIRVPKKTDTSPEFSCGVGSA